MEAAPQPCLLGLLSVARGSVKEPVVLDSVHVRACTSACVCVQVCMCVCVFMHSCACVYVCACMVMCVCMFFTYMYVCACVCVHVCMRYFKHC